MKKTTVNKRKIVNDPVYGFITLPSPLIYDLIEHPYFQRLRHIKQLGLTHLVYPGALHTRFHHALGAMHLMVQAIEVLRSKGVYITPDEAEGAIIAILLHDIGHGPFSHALESSIVENLSHETISAFFMGALNKQFNGCLSTALRIFKNTYPKKFLHQLVSGQLDMDRLDYLNRDSFYTGVSEGIIGSERIIKMLHVVNDELVVEAKGIYSVEKFILARSLMYWQVYLHKTVVSAEYLLINILKRAKELSRSGYELFATPALSVFLKNNINEASFLGKQNALEHFAQLDDYDIFASVKVWCYSDDKVLSMLSKRMLHRNLFGIEMQNEPFDTARINTLKKKAMLAYGIDKEAANAFVFTNKTVNSIYKATNDNINILLKDGRLLDITEASDQLDKNILGKTIMKYFLCYPKEI